MNVRLILAVAAPSGRGPGNGMFALQRALRKARPAWLRVGGRLRDGEIPWFWCWADRAAACACAATGRPFVIGPNMLFARWNIPCGASGERELCDAASCRLQFTESAWYREWILAHCGTSMRAPIVLWPYPIDPLPAGPLPATHDLLIYEKSGAGGTLVEELMRRWPASIHFRYGRFERQQLAEAARRARVCAYLSDNDRGPLALAEILLAGCPAVGIPRGAPWIVDGVTGFQSRGLDYASLCDAIERAALLDRHAVRAAAFERFDSHRTVQTILRALDAARWDE
jgi:hypothetical protein